MFEFSFTDNDNGNCQYDSLMMMGVVPSKQNLQKFHSNLPPSEIQQKSNGSNISHVLTKADDRLFHQFTAYSNKFIQHLDKNLRK